MQKLRAIHLYLGCIFAPMLLFFAISGMWQILGTQSEFLRKLSSIHTERGFKDGSQLGSVPMRIFIIIMAASFILSTVLGVFLAFKHSRNRNIVILCLALGLFVPALFVLMRLLR